MTYMLKKRTLTVAAALACAGVLSAVGANADGFQFKYSFGDVCS